VQAFYTSTYKQNPNRKLLAEPQNAMYRPLLLSSFALNHAISGYKVWSYHLVGLLLHIGCIFWVYAIGRRLLENDTAAMAAALIFGLHPINSEALNYISSRSEILAAFFFLLAFYAYVERSRAVLIFAYGAGLLSKSIVITLPLLMLCYALYDKRGWRREAVDFGVLGGITLVYLAMLRPFLYKAAISAPVRGYDEQIWTQVKGLVFYLKLLIEPIGLNLDHQFLISASLVEGIVAAAILLLGSLFSLSLWSWPRRPLPLFLLAWFLISLAPTFIIPLNVLVNEHRLYLASCAFALGAGALLKEGIRSWPKAQTNGVIFAMILLLGGLSIERNKVWASSYSLWQDAALKAPMMARPWIFLAETHQQDGHIPQATKAFEEVLRRDPYYTAGYTTLAELYLDQGRIEAADSLCQNGVTRAPSALLWSRYAEVYRYKAQQAVSQEAYALSMEQSAKAYRRGLELDSLDAAIHNNLGNTYQVLGQYEKALKHHQKALILAPNDARTHVNLGNLWLASEALEKAQTFYLQAIALDAEYAGAWLSLGSVYQRQGRRQEATKAYKTALRLDPSYDATVQKQLAVMESNHD
jgi:tetratricopeptide (TPR) repeat protein